MNSIDTTSISISEAEQTVDQSRKLRLALAVRALPGALL